MDNLISYVCIGFLWSFVHDTSVSKITNDPTYSGIIHNFSKSLCLGGGNIFLHGSNNQDFFSFWASWRWAIWSTIRFLFLFKEIIGPFILNRGKIEKVLNERLCTWEFIIAFEKLCIHRKFLLSFDVFCYFFAPWCNKKLSYYPCLSMKGRKDMPILNQNQVSRIKIQE